VAAPVLLVTHPDCGRHETGPEHLESALRLAALRAALQADGALCSAVREVQGAPALEEDLLRVHSRGLVDEVRRAALAARRQGLVWLEADTPVSEGSWDAALAAAGCVADAAELVLAGAADRAFALVRPPGHHATRDRAMGFCLFNNAAVAVRRLQAAGRARRVLIVDCDAHHGNGTQDLFYGDASVYTLSLHFSPGYPDSGAPEERGTGAGLGTTRNVPLPHGTRGADYLARFAEALDAVREEFEPELVVLSLGFDVLAGDPEGHLMLEAVDLHRLVSVLLGAMPDSARGRLVVVLEGGYSVERIGSGFVQVLRAMADLPPASGAGPAVR
jgi:acetoin utilization deacetylase AcuC-like enzyme